MRAQPNFRTQTDNWTCPRNPVIARFRPLLREDHSAEEFEVGLETLLDRLELSLSQ